VCTVGLQEKSVELIVGDQLLQNLTFLVEDAFLPFHIKMQNQIMKV